MTGRGFTTVGAPQARPPERSGALGPRERRRGGSAGAKPPGSNFDQYRRRFLGRIAMTIGAAHIGIGTTEASAASRELAAIGRATQWLNSPRLAPEIGRSEE